MTTYKYEAISFSGAAVNGVIEAHDENDAIMRIKENCSVINKLTEVKANPLEGRFKSQKINEKNLALVCRQFSIILTAGLPIVKSVELVAHQAEDKVLREMLTQVAGDVAAGYRLADSFELRGPGLPTTFIETVRAGEESGALEESFGKLATYFTKKAKLRGKVVTALTYPAFVLAVAVVVIIIIMTVAVPSFTKAFGGMGTQMPGVTLALIAMSEFFKKYLLLMVAVIVGLVLLWKVYTSTEKGRLTKGRVQLNMPVLGKVNRMNSASQLANTLSTMLSSGLPVMKALTITGKAMTNYLVGTAVTDIVAGVESGGTIGDGLRNTNLLPELLCEMAAVGEQTGSMEDTLNVIGVYYDNEVEQATNRAVSLLEPIIICVLAVFVVFVLLAVYLPMFSLYNTIG
ncbi:MAG: type II secretion system F family protein [Clostridiales bacterium]|nr:type II secretion system F family protein [Clostridiales bacterium]